MLSARLMYARAVRNCVGRMDDPTPATRSTSTHEIAAALPNAVGRDAVIRDGEILAPDRPGFPSFSRLQRRWPECRRCGAELRGLCASGWTPHWVRTPLPNRSRFGISSTARNFPLAFALATAGARFEVSPSRPDSLRRTGHWRAPVLPHSFLGPRLRACAVRRRPRWYLSGH